LYVREMIFIPTLIRFLSADAECDDVMEKSGED